MSKVSVGDKIYVAATLLDPPPRQSFEYAMASGTVAKVKNPAGKGGNQVQIDYQGSDGQPALSAPISVSKVHKHLGIVVVRIGDFQSESLLLDPLAKSVRDFCRLLIDQVQLLEVRSLAELRDWCAHNSNIRIYSHVILVGHGSRSSIEFASGGAQNAAAIGKALHIGKSAKKVIVSLACETGDAGFAVGISKATSCLYFAGPETAGSAAVGSLFCQRFLAENIIDGATPGVAFKHAAQSIPQPPQYALWRKGKKQA